MTAFEPRKRQAPQRSKAHVQTPKRLRRHVTGSLNGMIRKWLSDGPFPRQIFPPESRVVCLPPSHPSLPLGAAAPRGWLGNAHPRLHNPWMNDQTNEHSRGETLTHHQEGLVNSSPDRKPGVISRGCESCPLYNNLHYPI